MKKISACFILRDEGQTIYRALESCFGFVDEFVIGIDDKCTDNTEAEVTRFIEQFKPNNIVYKYTWKDSFCEARNEGMDKATGDYILIMDGHEYFPVNFYNITAQAEVPVREALLKVKEQLDGEIEEVHFQLYQQPFYGNTPSNFFLQPRVYLNRPDIRFGRNAHNTIQNVNQEKVTHYVEIILIHDAPADNRAWRQEQRIEMNTKALKEDIEKNPLDTRAMFYLGNTRLEAKDHSQAIYWYQRYLECNKHENSEKYQVLLHKGLAHIEEGDYKLAKDCFHVAIGIDPSRRDCYIALGDLESKLEKWDNAIIYYAQALNIKPQNSRMFQGGPGLTWDPHQKIARAYKMKGDNRKALSHLRIAYSYLNNEGWLAEIKDLSKDKLNLLVLDHIGSFTKELVEDLRKDDSLNVAFLPRFDSAMGIWADRIFVEWGDENAFESCTKHPQKCVVRIHGYEAYVNQELLKQIKWDKVKKVVFVAEHIRQMLKEIIPLEKSVVIQNGVNAEKFFVKNDERDKRNVGYAGYINEKKNPYLLLKIIKANPDKIFHLRSDFQSPFWKATFDYELKDCNNVVYHGRYDNLADFWNQMDSVLSTSIIESFSFNVAEGMACGCKPYIYNWKGAKEIWGERWIFEDMPCFQDSGDRKKYRKYITDNFALARNINSMREVLFGK
jgi:tetratricopeptide (TPR) repeat protein